MIHFFDIEHIIFTVIQRYFRNGNFNFETLRKIIKGTQKFAKNVIWCCVWLMHKSRSPKKSFQVRRKIKDNEFKGVLYGDAIYSLRIGLCIPLHKRRYIYYVRCQVIYCETLSDETFGDILKRKFCPSI